MCAIFPIGKYLSDGCYKSVYCVWNSWQDRWDAVSVMNMVDIIDSGNQVSAILQEKNTKENSIYWHFSHLHEFAL